MSEVMMLLAGNSRYYHRDCWMVF